MDRELLSTDGGGLLRARRGPPPPDGIQQNYLIALIADPLLKNRDLATRLNALSMNFDPKRAASARGQLGIRITGPEVDIDLERFMETAESLGVPYALPEAHYDRPPPPLASRAQSVLQQVGLLVDVWTTRGEGENVKKFVVTSVPDAMDALRRAKLPALLPHPLGLKEYEALPRQVPTVSTPPSVPVSVPASVPVSVPLAPPLQTVRDLLVALRAAMVAEHYTEIRVTPQEIAYTRVIVESGTIEV